MTAQADTRPNKTPPGHNEVHVTVEDGEEVHHKVLPSGPIADLLAALGLEGDLVLWLRRHGRRSLIDLHQPFVAEDGDRFIAVRGGGVS